MLLLLATSSCQYGILCPRLQRSPQNAEKGNSTEQVGHDSKYNILPSHRPPPLEEANNPKTLRLEKKLAKVASPQQSISLYSIENPIRIYAICVVCANPLRVECYDANNRPNVYTLEWNSSQNDWVLKDVGLVNLDYW